MAKNPQNKKAKFMSPTYEAWINMRTRCRNKNTPDYHRWGGRGISICSEWDTFDRFYKDMGGRPKGMTLDRIDNGKGYYKENCQWADRNVQANNRRSNRIISFAGADLTVAQWARITGIKSNTIRSRLDIYNWPLEKALSTGGYFG